MVTGDVPDRGRAGPRRNLQLQPVRIAAGGHDTESRLVFNEGFLVAVLVQLSDDHEDEAGSGFLEAGFGRLDTGSPPTFADLDEVLGWITRRLGGV